MELACDQPLSVAGKGTLPSEVMPYQALFIAEACTVVTQAAVPFVPPLEVHRTLASTVGSYVHEDGSRM